MNIDKIVNDIQDFLNKNEEYEDMKVRYILTDVNDLNYADIVAYNDDEVISIGPISFETNLLPDWAYSFDEDILGELEDGKKIAYMDIDTHYNIWSEINEYYPEDTEHKEGMQLYINYCKENGIDKDIIDKKTNLEVSDIMQFDIRKDEIFDNHIDMESEKAYFTFVLGYDVLQEMFVNSTTPECDTVYDFCNYEAGKFLESEEYKNPRHSGYEMLQEWVENNKNKIVEDFKEMTVSEIEVYNGNMRIIDKGFRGDQPVALVEKTLSDKSKEYIIAFYYSVDVDKLSWGYGYYYDTDISKAKQDYQKVTNGGNLADTFERKEER